MATSSTTAGPGNLLALKGGFRSVTIRDAISVEVGRELDRAGTRDRELDRAGTRDRALADALASLYHLRIANLYLASAGLLRDRARPRAVSLTAVEMAGLARRQLALVSPDTARPLLAELEGILSAWKGELDARGTPIRDRATPWKTLYVRLADELVRVRDLLLTDGRHRRHRGVDAAAAALAADEAAAELRRRYPRGDAS